MQGHNATLGRIKSRNSSYGFEITKSLLVKLNKIGRRLLPFPSSITRLMLPLLVAIGYVLHW